MEVKIYLGNTSLLITDNYGLWENVRQKEILVLYEADYAIGEIENQAGLYDTIVCLAPDVNSVLNTFKNQYTFIEAAGGIVENEFAEILMIYRRYKWDLPKGKIEITEEQLPAAIREIEEETGVKHLTHPHFLTTTYHTYTEKNKNILKACYWFAFKAKSEESLTPQTEEDITSLEWVPIALVPDKLNNSFPSIRDVFEHFVEWNTK